MNKNGYIKNLTNRLKKGHKIRNTGRTRFRKDSIPWNRGLKGYRAGVKHPWMAKGKNHWNWQGGKSLEPYGIEFNNDFKEVIRNRERRKCFICERIELDCRELLHCHHIDYNKYNNNPNNLVALCRNCHMKTNHNRNYWIKYFNKHD